MKLLLFFLVKLIQFWKFDALVASKLLISTFFEIHSVQIFFQEMSILAFEVIVQHFLNRYYTYINISFQDKKKCFENSPDP